MSLVRMIAFTGLDGAGKTTQIKLLEEHLTASGRKVAVTWSRGGYTGLFMRIKQALRNILGEEQVPSGPSARRNELLHRPLARTIWLWCAIMDMALLYGVVFRWRIFCGKVQLADRYLWDTWIDFKINFPGADINRMLLWRFLVKVAPHPEHTLFLSIPIAEALRRCQEKEEPFFTGEAILEERNRYYFELSQRFGWSRVDAAEPTDVVFQSIKRQLGGGTECA